MQSSQLPKLLLQREMKATSYSNGVGSIVYEMVYSRPDQAHVLSVVSRFMTTMTSLLGGFEVNAKISKWNNIVWSSV